MMFRARILRIESIPYQVFDRLNLAPFPRALIAERKAGLRSWLPHSIH